MLRRQDDVTALARCPMTARLDCHPVRSLLYVGRRVGHRSCEASALHCGKVNEVITHKASLFQGHAVFASEFRDRETLVSDVL
jgi:hypothetical protein